MFQILKKKYLLFRIQLIIKQEQNCYSIISFDVYFRDCDVMKKYQGPTSSERILVWNDCYVCAIWEGASLIIVGLQHWIISVLPNAKTTVMWKAWLLSLTNIQILFHLSRVSSYIGPVCNMQLHPTTSVGKCKKEHFINRNCTWAMTLSAHAKSTCYYECLPYVLFWGTVLACRPVYNFVQLIW